MIGTYERVMSHTWMSLVTHMHERCHMYRWVMLHIWMSYVAQICRSEKGDEWHTYVLVMWHTWMSDDAMRINESCHTHEWVMSRIWISHVTHMNESCRTNLQVQKGRRLAHMDRFRQVPRTLSCRQGLLCWRLHGIIRFFNFVLFWFRKLALSNANNTKIALCYAGVVLVAEDYTVSFVFWILNFFGSLLARSSLLKTTQYNPFFDFGLFLDLILS